MAKAGLKVLMVTSELVPFAKTGGLADMVGALAKALDRLGHEVRIVLPRYYFVDVGRLQRIRAPLGVAVGGGEEWCAVYAGKISDNGATVFFLDHEELYGRDGIYGTRMEPSFEDNLKRFTVLCRGALQLARMQGFVPDVVHAHDWPAALAPVYLNTVEKDGTFAATASLLTIHNLGYQGEFPKGDFPYIGLPWEDFHGAGFENFDSINLLQAGIRNADLMTTVSPTYAAEIQTPEFGNGLDGLLRFRRQNLFGVLNGMDYELWNPESDPLIAANYSHRGYRGKLKNKLALQEEMGLPVEPAVPLYGMVTRLVEQKGLRELCAPGEGCLAAMLDDLDLQVAILGTGETWCEAELMSLSGSLPNLAVRTGYDDRLAHQIEAGADFFLMPSRYEPCGLSQMYSLRYGTLPIVHRTGGLADTVENYDEETGEGTGFVFDALTPSAIYNTVGWSMWAWHNRPEHIRAMRKRAMKLRFSWEDSARQYANLYRGAIERRLGRVPGV